MKYILSAEDMLNSLRALPHSYRHTVETALIKIKMSCMWPKDEFVIPGLFFVVVFAQAVHVNLLLRVTSTSATKCLARFLLARVSC